MAAPAASTMVQAIRDTSPEWMNDFTVSVNSTTGKYIGIVCFILWLTGIFFMLLFQLRARKKLYFLKKTAVPAGEPKIKKLFSQCCRELGIKKEPAFYISPLLKTPVMTGIIKPGVYLPAHLASDTSCLLYTSRSPDLSANFPGLSLPPEPSLNPGVFSANPRGFLSKDGASHAGAFSDNIGYSAAFDFAKAVISSGTY